MPCDGNPPTRRQARFASDFCEFRVNARAFYPIRNAQRRAARLVYNRERKRERERERAIKRGGAIARRLSHSVM